MDICGSLFESYFIDLYDVNIFPFSFQSIKWKIEINRNIIVFISFVYNNKIPTVYKNFAT